MSRRALRPRANICHFCDFVIARQLTVRKSFDSTRSFSTTRRAHAQKVSINAPKATAKPSSIRPGSARSQPVPSSHIQAQIPNQLHNLRARCEAILAREVPPSEQEAEVALKLCNSLADILVEDASPLPFESKDGTPASALLSVDQSPTKKVRPQKISPIIQQTIDDLSNLAYSIVKHPPVFISPTVLEIYVQTQSRLGKPETFPEVFYMYANKPVPKDGSSPIQYSNQNPNKLSNAISQHLADAALQTAIDNKQLLVAIDIVDSTYTTKAFHRAKLLRKGIIPGLAAAIAPVAAYTAASQLALLQTTVDSGIATNVAFVGLIFYMGFTATVGVVAVSTANDQMDRVTWAQGLPLRDRWIREEERAALDKIAGAWGFSETWRRGEEEGEDWDTLREVIGRRGMVLDKAELMEGME